MTVEDSADRGCGGGSSAGFEVGFGGNGRSMALMAGATPADMAQKVLSAMDHHRGQAFGGLLRAHRERALLTQEQLAERSGMSARTIRELEHGRVHRPRGQSVRLLADALGLAGQDREEFHAAVMAEELAGGAPSGDGAHASGAAAATVSATGERAAPSLLPPDVADFTGRDAVATRIRELLAGGGLQTAVVVSAVAGKGGVGKTALVVHVAHRVRERFPDGQLYVDLGGAGAHPADPGEVLGWLLSALGVHGSAIPTGLQERAALYRARLDGRRVLVVLDNAAGEGQVRPLLPGSPSCGVVVTSRTRLGGLEGAHLVDLDVLDPGQAVVLLGRIVGADRVAAEPAAAERIVRLCGLLPLAVRVAGARLAARAHRSLGWLAARLADERRRLDELAHGDLEVRASLALSYQALDAERRRAFRLLSLVGAPDFAAWAASALLDVPLERAEELAEGLVDAQLLEVASHGTGGVRWRFHDLLRIYARELAAAEPPGEPDAALERFLGACLTLVEEANLRETSSSYGVRRGAARPWPLPAEATAGLLADPAAWFEAERRLLVGAVELACEAGLDEPAWELATSPAELLERGWYADEWRHTHELALAATRRASNRRGEAVLLRGLGQLDAVQDRPTDAAGWFEQAKVVFEEVGDDHGVAVTEACLGTVSLALGHHSEALDQLCRALPVLRQVGDLRSQAVALRALGTADLQQGRPGDALGRFEEGLAVARRADYRYGEAHLLRWLARAYAEQSETDRAIGLLAQALAIFGQLGARLGEAYALATLGELYLRQGRVEQARVLLDRSLRICRELGELTCEAYALHDLGRLHLAQARADQAIGCLRQALTIGRTIGRPLLVARVLASLGEAYEAVGDQAAARSTWHEALALFRQLQLPEAGTLARRLAQPSTARTANGPAGNLPPGDPRQGAVRK
jgi:tetratricopeptide (TPR) repeat protein/transcriptional regulator with XRE-family HTH domain